MKKLFTVVLLFAVALSASAQFEKGKKYVGASATGLGFSYSSNEKFRFGLEARAGYFVADCLMLTANLGYDHTRAVDDVAADSAGPYDYDMVTRLSNLAKENHIPAVLDVYPHYSSDVAVAWKSGLDVPAALIGPGVQASHGMERTHVDAMLATLALVERYLDCR